MPLRTDFLVEYHGEFEHHDQYVELKPPLWQTPPFFKLPAGVTASKMQDTTNNTYSCLRTLETVSVTPSHLGAPKQSTTSNRMFCLFYANGAAWRANVEYTTEYYELQSDPLQMNNTAALLPPARRAALRKRLDELRGCSGRASCGGNGP